MYQKLNIFTPVYHDVPSFLILRENIKKQLNSSIYKIHFHVIDDTAGVDAEIEQLTELEDVDVITPPFNLATKEH